MTKSITEFLHDLIAQGGGKVILLAIVLIAALGLLIAARIKIFTKADYKWYHALIPIYSTMIWYEITIGYKWVILIHLLALIPGINMVIYPLVALVVEMCAMYMLAINFGKESSYGIGLVLGMLFCGIIGTILYLSIAFGDSEYEYSAKKLEEYERSKK